MKGLRKMGAEKYPAPNKIMDTIFTGFLKGPEIGFATERKVSR